MRLPILVQTHDLAQFHEILNEEGIDIEKNTTISIRPTGQNIRIDQIRSLKRYLINSGKSSRHIIFYTFHKATTESQNALLKILEETGTKYRFALQVDSVELVLSTIRSRCRIIIASHEPINTQLFNLKLSDFSEKNLFEEKMTITKKEEAEVFILETIALLRIDLKKGKAWTIDVIKKNFYLLYLLKHNNLNPQLAVDQSILNISRCFNL